MEGKKEVLIREASESGLQGSDLQDKLAELDSIKPCPYGTLHAVGSHYLIMYILCFVNLDGMLIMTICIHYHIMSS